MNWKKNLLAVILNMVCVQLCVTITCPYDSKDCICTPPLLKCYSLQEIPQLRDEVTVSNITTVFFDGGNITKVPAKSLPAGVTALLFLDLPLTNISKDAFQNVASALRSVRFKNAAFRELPEALIQLNNFTSLSISNTHIYYWNIDIIQQTADSLESLLLENVSLSSWPEWVHFFHSLITLSLSQNPIKYIPENAFSSMKDTLRALYLFDTSLIEFPPTAELSRLRALELGRNQIQVIASDSLCPSIENLYISLNNITEITNTSFPENSSMKSLKLLLNPIGRISYLALKPLSKITSLDISFIHLAEFPLPVTSLTTLTSLRVTSSLSCPCQTQPELVKWFKSYNETLSVNGQCSTGIEYETYLRFEKCETKNSVYYNKAASSLVRRSFYEYGYVLLLSAISVTRNRTSL